MTLIVIACGIAYHSARQINKPDILPEPGGLALMIAVLSIISKEWIYRYTVAAAPPALGHAARQCLA